MPYSITREDPERDLRALRAAIERFSYPDEDEALQLQAVQELADSIEEQVKPVVEEPTEWGSVVKATCGLGPSAGLFWVKTGRFWVSDNPGESGDGWSTLWRHLDVIEVLRVGVGEGPAQAYQNGRIQGESHLRSVLVEKLARLHDRAVTGPERHQLSLALGAVMAEL